MNTTAKMMQPNVTSQSHQAKPETLDPKAQQSRASDTAVAAPSKRTSPGRMPLFRT